MQRLRSQRFSLALVTGVALAAVVAAGDDFPLADRPIHETVDHFVGAALKQKGVAPAHQAPEANLLRRLMLDLVGRIPTASETAGYVSSTDPGKRTASIDRLMKDPAFVEHQVNEFSTFLMGSSNSNLRGYLSEAIRTNRPWSQVFRDLLDPTRDREATKGAESYLAERAKDIDRLTVDASVKFFGVNISCAKCHDHPHVPDWTQDIFYNMKSFFSRTYEHGAFAGEHDHGLVSFKTTKGESRKASLRFLAGPVIAEPEVAEPSGDEKKKQKKQLEELKKKKQPPPKPKFSRRVQLIEAGLQKGQNEFFSRSIVNRIWHRFFGQGLVMPLDQMHPKNVPSHPELMEWLSRDLVAHDYDLRRLMRGILLSQAYSRSSQWTEGERPPADLFAVAVPRPLTPRQYGASLWVAATSPKEVAGSVNGEELQKRLLDIRKRGDSIAGSFEQPGENFQVSVDEALLLSNGQKFQDELLKESDGLLVGHLLKSDNLQDRVRIAYLNVFGRSPTPDESRVLEEYLKARQDRPVEACQQLVWSLMTSTEFRFNY